MEGGGVKELGGCKVKERGRERERFGKGRENYQRHLTCSSGNFSPHSSYVWKIRNNIQKKEQQHVAFKHRVTNIVFVGVGGGLVEFGGGNSD